MPNVFNFMPELEPDEMSYLQGIFNNMSDQEAQQFATIYRARRRDPLLILITAAIGFFGVAGVHRFILGSIGMGLLYLFTGGLCFIGTIIDVVNYKRLAFEYNVKEAQQVHAMMMGQYGGTNGYGV
ncbi:TM2 domain-containing protein [Pontibacter sp. JH31]|uniref:TM2 domain-containing protein n=1 Tax=Pontibacter aquaedesilientis TaxID=2766980 RepID=A0ABR7XI70_9BACT|nr:TM2 domain-containing protein [Pontibacter aquaedesilientis]MBD1398002.1 TM2 domain-containing protein [Pontibacter aquaedesilientis]